MFTPSEYKSDNNTYYRMIQLTDLFVYFWGIMGASISDYIKRRNIFRWQAL